MARKRLSDLLREEAHKPSDDTAAQQAESAEQNGEKPTAKPSTKTSTAKARSTAARSTRQTAATATEPASQPAAEDETMLQQQIADLEAELETQTALVKKLQAELEHTQSLKAELEQTKKDALRLAEGNSKLKEELEALKQTVKTTPAKASTALTTREEIQQKQSLLLAHPVFPAADTPGQLSNQDMGWVD